MSTEDNATAPPPPAAAAHQTVAVKEIMSKVISVQSTKKYAGQNATFAFFCYHSEKLWNVLLEPWFIEEVRLQATAHAKQQCVKEMCVKMCPQDDNCPLILSNLTFEQFSDFVTQHKARRGKGRGLTMSLGNASYKESPRLPIPAVILRIPVFSIPVALFSQESRFLFRRNFFLTPSEILSVLGLRRKLHRT